MLEEFLHGIHSGVGNLRFLEAGDDFAGGEPAEDLFNGQVQVVPIRNASRSRIESRISDQFNALENNTAESFPFALVLEAQENRRLISAWKGPIRSDRCASGPCARRSFAAMFRVAAG